MDLRVIDQLVDHIFKGIKDKLVVDRVASQKITNSPA